ncbi:MAG: pyridoxamine 5'-phosphate oxidase family protein [Nitrososphaeraceae archaeon]|nr:pyridoxamine 5'-phosphate oxidase family protein [Nitrososphaeraceae archaeon]
MLKILNASPGFGAPLSEQDMKDFLTTKILNIHLGTVDEKGHANIHPAWYYYDSSDNKFYILTGKESKKITNLRMNELIYFCVDDPNPPYKGVRGKGNAKMHEDINFNIPIWEKIMKRYLGNSDDPTAKGLLDEVKRGAAVVLEISPIYYSTWDYSKQLSLRELR